MATTMLEAMIEEETRDVKWELHEALRDVLGAIARFRRAKAKAKEFELPVAPLIKESIALFKKQPPAPHLSSAPYLFEDAANRWSCNRSPGPMTIGG